MSTVSTMNTMNTTNTTNSLTIKGLIGKEFLYDENLFISNYNPFVTTNTSGINGLYPDTTLTGKLYIFNKKEYMEPTKEEFQNIKSISELADAHYRLINESTFNYLSVLILSKYNENSKERTFQLIKENSVVDINPILSNGLGINDFLYNPENNNLGTFAILVIDHSTETGKLNKKTYTDLAVGEQFLMYLIPSELINISESGTDSTKLISLTLSDASKLVLSEFGNYPDDSVENKIDQQTNFFPNKFGIRIKEELYKNLFVKQNQVLEAYGETIKFVNPDELTKSVMIEEITRPVALPVNADIFLKWMEELSTETFFDKYNDYRYFAGSYDVGKDFSLVIPELIFNILYTRDLYELNKEIFKMYLISNPPSQETDPEMIINEDYIDTILYCFYRCRVGKDGSYISNKNALVFGANGLALPDISSIEYSSKIVDYGFIFFPQRHKANDNDFNDNVLKNSIQYNSQYLESMYNSSIRKKVDKVAKDFNVKFDYYISPNGKNTNHGKSPEFPKFDFTGIPQNSKVLLLPGVYNTIIKYSRTETVNDWNQRKIVEIYGLSIFPKIVNYLDIYGCGDETLFDIKFNASYNITNRDGNREWQYYYNYIQFFMGSNCNLYNFKIKWDINPHQIITDNRGYTFSESNTNHFYNINFESVGNYFKVASNNLANRFFNCEFMGGTLVGNDVPNNEFVHDSNIQKFIDDSLGHVKTNRNSVTNLKDNYDFKPMYTLIPLNEGQNEDNQSKTINLETTRNISKIPNLNYKLS